MTRVASLALFAFVFTSVSAGVIPPRDAPAGWDYLYLEDYATYHARYLALGCKYKHGKPFFDECCHPLLATDKLETARPRYCVPSAAEPAQEADFDSCEEGEENEDTGDQTASETGTLVRVSEALTKRSDPAVEHLNNIDASTSNDAHPANTDAPNALAPAFVNLAASASANTGGFATFFYQNGNAGACGKYHSDWDHIAAIDSRRYGNLGIQSYLCGRRVRIRNTGNGKTVDVTIADACPTCKNANSIDLSVGAFTAIATESQGLVGIEWWFI